MINRTTLPAAIAALIALGASGSAFAIPLSSAPQTSWSGLYGGLNGGWVRGTSDAAYSTGTAVAPDMNLQGAIVGLTGGWNWQRGSFLFGVEGDYDIGRVKNNGGGITAARTTHIDLVADTLATFRGRLGWLPNDDWLLFVTGGMAWAHVTRQQIWDLQSTPPPAGTLGKQTVGVWQSGWVVGAGVERALGDNWTAKLEYSYASFGSVLFPLSLNTRVAGGGAMSADLSVQTLRFGLNKHFGGGQVGSIGMNDNPFDWSGFYVGLNSGWSTGRSVAAFGNGDPAALDLQVQGAHVGGQFGYNWRKDMVLFGIEGELNATRTVQRDTGVISPYLSHIDETVDQVGSIRARLGWIPNNDWLLYATGGIALAHATRFQVYDALGGGGILNTQLTGNYHQGWIYGLGVERAIGHNWSAKLEYTHAQFDRQLYPLTFTPAGSGTVANLSLDTIKFGINRHF